MSDEAVMRRLKLDILHQVFRAKGIDKPNYGQGRKWQNIVEEDLIHGSVQLVPDGRMDVDGRIAEDGYWTGPIKGIFTSFDHQLTFDVAMADVTRFRVKPGANSFRCVAALPPSGRPRHGSKPWLPPCWPLLDSEMNGVAGVEFVRRRFIYVDFRERRVREGSETEWVGWFKGLFIKWDSTLPPYQPEELDDDGRGPEVPVKFRSGFRSLVATSRASVQDVNFGEFMDQADEMDFSDIVDELKTEPHEIRVSKETKAINIWTMFGLDPDTATTDDVEARTRALDHRIGRIPSDDPVFAAMIESGWDRGVKGPISFKERRSLLLDAAAKLSYLTIYANCVRMDNGRPVNVHKLVGLGGKSTKVQVEKVYRQVSMVKIKDLDPKNDPAFVSMKAAGWEGDPTTADGRKERKALLKAAQAKAIELALDKGEFDFFLRKTPDNRVRLQAADVLEVNSDDSSDTIKAQVAKLLRLPAGKVVRNQRAGAIKALRKAGWGGSLSRHVMGAREELLLQAARALLPNKAVDELKSELDKDCEARTAQRKPASRPARKRQGNKDAAPAAPARPAKKVGESAPEG